MTIPEIFHSKGEIKFREIEKEYFRKIINAKRKDLLFQSEEELHVIMKT